MIECSEENAALFSKLSVFAGNLEIRTDEAHGRDTAEADDDLRLDQLRLRAQEADTRILSVCIGSRFLGGRHLTMFVI